MIKERLEKIITLWRRMDRIGENLQWLVMELRKSEKNRQSALDDTHGRIDGLREEIGTIMKEIMELMVEQDKK